MTYEKSTSLTTEERLNLIKQYQQTNELLRNQKILDKINQKYGRKIVDLISVAMACKEANIPVHSIIRTVNPMFDFHLSRPNESPSLAFIAGQKTELLCFENGAISIKAYNVNPQNLIQIPTEVLTKFYNEFPLMEEQFYAELDKMLLSETQTESEKESNSQAPISLSV